MNKAKGKGYVKGGMVMKSTTTPVIGKPPAQKPVKAPAVKGKGYAKGGMVKKKC